MSSYTAVSKSSSEMDGWTHIGRGGSKFNGDSVSAFGSRSSRAEFSENTTAGPRSHYVAAEFNDAAASAFGGRGGLRSFEGRAGGAGVSRYGGRSVQLPLKKQNYNEAFPTLSGASAPASASASASASAAESESRAPTLAEKLRKKVAEETVEGERRAKLTKDATARHAVEAHERAIFATLGASRAATNIRYTNEYDDDVPVEFADDLDYGAFGESVEPRGGAYKASAYDPAYEGYGGEGEDDY